MADMSKAEKLAAARKKLKEFQQKSKDTSSGVKTTSRKNGGITKNVNNDVNTTRNFVFDSGPHDPEGTPLATADASQEPGPPTYDCLDFSSVAYSDSGVGPRRYSPDSNRSSGNVSLDRSSARDFFDHFPGQTQDWLVTQTPQDYSTSRYEPNLITPASSTELIAPAINEPSPVVEFVAPPTDAVPTVAEFVSPTIGAPQPLAEFIAPTIEAPTPTQEFIAPTIGAPTPTAEFVVPTIGAPTSMIDFVAPTIGHPTPMAEFDGPLIGATQTGAEFVAPVIGAPTLVPEIAAPVIGAPTAMAECVTTWSMARPIVEADEADSPPTSARSTTESIRQLSRQVNGLIGEGAATGGGASELEHRNQELAAMLAVERQAREQLQLQLQEYQSHVSRLSAQLESQRSEAESRGNRELAAVQEQLKLHVQTVGILVAEKTELQSALSHCQADAKLRVSETEDLQGRLKASRYRVSELEKETVATRSALESSEASRRASTAELDRLRLDRSGAAAREREWEEERGELSHRLSARTAEWEELGRELHEARARLSLAQLRVTQLTGTEGDGGADSLAQMEALHAAKISLEQRVTELESALKKSESDNDRSSQQFQQYVRGVETQVAEMTEKLEKLEAEKRSLIGREQSLMGHMTELEKRIQLQDQQKPERLPTPDVKLHERLSQLEAEKRALGDELSTMAHRSSELEAGLHGREARIEELEAMLDRMQGDQPDQSRLLAAMESDKVAAARAVSQNQRLKVELQELQDGFVALSNCKLDLTDKLEHERHRSRQLEEQIRAHMVEHEGSDHSHDHEHGHHDGARLAELSSQNEELRKLVARLTTAQEGDQNPEGMDTHKSELVASLSASVKQLEAERNQLKEELTRLQRPTETTSAVTKEAMDQLQEQFTRKMAEIADLSDERQRLEHLVLQLQGETETIGEYITLYQKQRGLLRQRAEEKDNQLKCLAQDREEMRLKLAKLNGLIGRLVAEKADAPAELTNGELAEMERQVSEVADGSEAESGADKADTADKILALLSEIGTSNLVDPHHPVEHFHPCAWCSGRLITV